MNEKQKIEEIDLIKSFSYFGKIINRLFSISVNIFIAFANLIIRLFTIIKKKFWVFMIAKGRATNNANNLRFSKKRITDKIISVNTNVSRSANEL